MDYNIKEQINVTTKLAQRNRNKTEKFSVHVKEKNSFTLHNKWSPHPLYSLSTSYIVAESVP